jgi:hypothetical protein
MAMLNSPQPPIKMHSIYLFFSILTTAPCGFYSVLFAAKLKNRTMEIIIDGYNLIGSNAGLTGNLEHSEIGRFKNSRATTEPKAIISRLFLTVGGRVRLTKSKKIAMELASFTGVSARKRTA